MEGGRCLHNHYSPSTTQLPDKHGITALLAAVYEDHVDCVRVLVSSVRHVITAQQYSVYHICEKFRQTKPDDDDFDKPSYLCIAEIFGGINFRQ